MVCILEIPQVHLVVFGKRIRKLRELQTSASIQARWSNFKVPSLPSPVSQRINNIKQRRKFVYRVYCS